MGSKWLKNFLGFTLSDEDMKDIPYPRTELAMHITFKTVEMGSIVGAIVVSPIKTLIGKPRSLVSLMQNIKVCGYWGAVVGLVLGPVLSWMVIRRKPIDYDGAYDRCYRLRYNRDQVWVDRCAVVGAGIGGVGSVLKVAHPGHSMVIGLMSGTAAGAVLNRVRNKK